MAQQVYGCKRARLLEVASDFARLLLIEATATDCPRSQPRPGTPSDGSCTFWDLSCAVKGPTHLLLWQDPQQHIRKQGAYTVPAPPEQSANSQLWPAWVASVGAAGGGGNQWLPPTIAAARRGRLRPRASGHACSRTLVAPLRIKWLGDPAGDLHEGAAADAPQPPVAATDAIPYTRAPTEAIP
jgi:hypothetical protein